MKYNVVAISDIHWGVINPDEQKESLQFFIDFIKEYKDTIDLIVILGDYWDSKLSLNSKEAITAVSWMHQLQKICKSNAITVRLVQGTMDHDNDQLHVFDNLGTYEMPKDYPQFRIITKTTVEETLPNFTCVYCPDETIKTSEYEETYMNEIIQMKDIGFFHGSFDVVYGSLLEAKPELWEKNNVIFKYSLWTPRIKGPMISGHWHDGKQYDELYYIGSPFRWQFDEDEEKGFYFIQYDTDTTEYMLRKIVNPLACEYYTYDIYSNLFETKDDYAQFIREIRDIIQGMDNSITKDKLRIKVYINDEKSENDVFLSALRQEIINHKNCKITVKNKIKDKKAKAQKKKIEDEKKQVSFVFQDDVRPQNKIRQFILEESNHEVDIPLEFIERHMKDYIK